MKRIISIMVLLLVVVVAMAQNMSVASFEPLIQDQSANLQGTMKIDQNGEVCAIIKVQTTATGLTFDVGSLGIVATEQKPGEVWVYVPHGVKRISIGHSTLGFIRNYSIPCTIEAARTYLLVLTTGTVHTMVEEAVTSQYVLFNVEPKNAFIELDNQALEVTDGTARKRMPFGSYTYRVQAPRYYPEVGNIKVNDPQNKHVVTVKLKPAFSPITFKATDGVEIWVDGERKGMGQWTGEMGYETVMVECRKENHRSTRREITITADMAGQTITLDAPQPILGSVDFDSTPADADIYVDGKKIGTTPMFLPKHIIGKHKVRISRSGYQDYASTVKIEEGKTVNVTAKLEERVEAVPAAATVTEVATATTVSASSNSSAIASANRTFTVKGVSFTMIAVEGGTFTMGATSEMTEPRDDEKPTHQVTLSSYSIGETEVTQALWEAVMGNNPSSFKGANRPVEKVSWNDCQTFIQKLNSLTGQNFRLPTEAEWEFAARGGNKSRHTQYSGSSDLNTVAWHKDNSGSTTHDVRTKQPNELGIYDMTGNVRELCNDWYGNYSSSAQTNPTGPSSGSDRVNRGGSWFNSARGCRSSGRSGDTPSCIHYSLGLRLAL